MLNVRSVRNGHLAEVTIDNAGPLESEALWIDLKTPSDEERNWIKAVYGQELATKESINEIEATSRFYEDEQGLHLRSYFLRPLGDRVVNTSVGFTLSPAHLFSLRHEELPAFTDFLQQARHTPSLADNPFAILLGLFEAEIDRIADFLEKLYAELGKYGKAFFSTGQKNLENVLTHIAGIEDLNGRARLSLMDEQRALSSLLRSGKLPPLQEPCLVEILRDIDSLLSHSSALFEKVNFLMDVTMGKINIEQNKIIKIFSIAAVVFLPPTLVASLYGMNFHFMPELAWKLGYPLALGLMVGSGIAPYWFFKRKGWL